MASVWSAVLAKMVGKRYLIAHNGSFTDMIIDKYGDVFLYGRAEKMLRPSDRAHREHRCHSRIHGGVGALPH